MVIEILVNLPGHFHSLKWGIGITYTCKWRMQTECDDAEIYMVRLIPMGQGLKTEITMGAGGNCQGEKQKE